MPGNVKKWIWNIISSNLPACHELEALRKILLINSIALLGCLFIFILAIVAFFQDDYLLAVTNIVILTILCWLFVYLRVSKRYDFVGIMGSGTMFLFYSFLIAYGGVSKTAYMWCFTYPLIATYLLGSKFGSIMSVLLLAFSGVVFFIGSRVSFIANYDSHLIVRFIPTYCVIFLFSIIVEKVRTIFQNRLTESNNELAKQHKEKDELIYELQESMLEIKKLQGIIPMCAKCKKIRDDQGYWEQVEKYVQDRSDAQFSHGICPECAKELYPGYSR